MLSIIFVVIGGALAIATEQWWRAEVAGRVGEEIAAKAAFQCLKRLGTGDCEHLWLVGLHQSNQVAGLIFYGGIILAVVGLLLGVWRAVSRRG